MYSTQNEVKFVVPERFIRPLKNKIYKSYMTVLSKNACIAQLDEKLINIITHTREQPK